MTSILRDKHGFVYNEFELAMQLGKIDGAKVVWKVWSTEQNVNGEVSTVCYGGTGIYTYHLGYGVDADYITIVSDNALDDGILIKVDGLDEDGNLQEETIAVGGTSTMLWSRFFGGVNIDSREFIGLITANKLADSSPVGFFSVIDQSTFRAERPRSPIPELTDVEVRMIPNANDLNFSVTFGIIVLGNSNFNII